MKKFILVVFLLSMCQCAYADVWGGWFEDKAKAENTSVDTSNFDTNLTSADDTVQKALDTIDELVAGGGSVEDDAYGVGWDGDTTNAPSQNAVYDKIETLAGGHDAVSIDVNADTIFSLSTQEIGLDTQTANYLFAGPVSGGAAVPDFRALVAADLPANVVQTGSINWDSITGGEIQRAGINWSSLSSDIQGAGINWTSITVLAPITEAMIGDLGSYLTSESDPNAALLAGRAGGQTIKGGTGEGESLSFWTNATGVVGSYYFTDLTDNGFVKTSGGTGQLSVDTNTYLTSESDPSVDTSGEIVAIIGGGVYEPAGVAVADITDASANGRSLISAANYAAMKGLLDVDDVITLSGVAAGETHLSTFTGSTISDNGTIKAGMQELETELETKADRDGNTFTGTHDFGGAVLEIPNSTSLPGTCTVGDLYMDTDATSGQRFYLCESADTWKLQGDGGGAGGTSSLWLVAASAILDDSSPPGITITESTGTGTPRRHVVDFDAATDEIIYWSFDWRGFTTATVYWYSNDTGADEDAIWACSISATTAADADSMAEDAAGSTNTESGNVDTNEANRLLTTEITLTNTDSAATGDLVTMRFWRDADDSEGDADNDSLTSDARVLGVLLEA